jgi:hypothetical protein
MIRVTVELISAVDPSRSCTLAMMDIANDGVETAANARLGTYNGRAYRGRSRAELLKGVVQRRGELRAWRRQDLHVWSLVAAMLAAMGYGRKEGA